MEFCPKCNMRLAPTRDKKKEVLQLVCSKCGYKKPAAGPLPFGSNIVEQIASEPIVVLGKEEQELRTLPTVRVECPKCSNTTALAWLVQTRGTDESSTQFFRCTICSHTFREYS